MGVKAAILAGVISFVLTIALGRICGVDILAEQAETFTDYLKPLGFHCVAGFAIFANILSFFPPDPELGEGAGDKPESDCNRDAFQPIIQNKRKNPAAAEQKAKRGNKVEVPVFSHGKTQCKRAYGITSKDNNRDKFNVHPLY